MISKSGSDSKAGTWAIEAKPRLGFSPTMPTRILVFVAIDASPILRAFLPLHQLD
jgi:hypothetical protein